MDGLTMKPAASETATLELELAANRKQNQIRLPLSATTRAKDGDNFPFPQVEGDALDNFDAADGIRDVPQRRNGACRLSKAPGSTHWAGGGH
jgi:hypothetical protein